MGWFFGKPKIKNDEPEPDSNEQIEENFHVEKEDETEEAMDRTRCEGALDTLTELYKLTCDLSFAIGIREENRKDGHI